MKFDIILKILSFKQRKWNNSPINIDIQNFNKTEHQNSPRAYNSTALREKIRYLVEEKIKILIDLATNQTYTDRDFRTNKFAEVLDLSLPKFNFNCNSKNY